MPVVILQEAQLVCLELQPQPQQPSALKISCARPDRVKEAVKVILLNLYIGSKLDMPIRYSRNRNRYSRDKRYGMLYFKPRIIKIVDALKKRGYIDHKDGGNFRDKGIGRESRMWATPKLNKLFQQYEWDIPNLIVEDKPVEPILLNQDVIIRQGRKKEVKKRLIQYEDNDRINYMREDIVKYNNYIDKQTITITLNREECVNQLFMRDLLYNLYKGYISVNSIQVYHRKVYNNQNIVLNTNVYQIDRRRGKVYERNISPITNTLRNELDIPVVQYFDDNAHYCFIDYVNSLIYHTVRITNNKERNKKLIEKNYLSDYGIVKLQFTINYKYLHRIFNKSSFDFGGRFYGGGHMGLPRFIRKNCMEINGIDTVEPDYSSLHIRMLYHMEGIQYTDDPYMALCDNEDDRDFFKRLQLIAINAGTEVDAIQAIRDHYISDDDENYFLGRKNPDKKHTDYYYIKEQLNRFKKVHSPIAKYLNTRIGLTLQNIDSRITDAILMRLTPQDIPCLPVHDSYIVQHIHRDALVKAMAEEYEKVMGFEPVIDF